MSLTKINAAGIGSTETVTLHSLEVVNNASIGGVLTYEDVTNVDSIGIITARAGVLVGSGITLSKDGDGFFTGVTTATTFVGALTGTASGNPTLTGSTNDTLVTVTGANAIQGESNLTWNGTLLNVITTGTDAALFESTSGDANGVQLSLRATSASPADDDKLAILDFSGRDDAGNNTTYAQIRSHSRDVSNGSEDGDITFHTRSDGSFGERLRIASGGSVLINTTVDTEASSDGNDLVIGSTSDTAKGLSIVGSTSGGIGNIFFSDGASYKNQGNIQYRHADDSMRFSANQSEALRIDSNRRVIIGHTAARAVAGHTAGFTLDGDDYNVATIQITSNQNSSAGTYLQFSHQRSGSAGGSTILQDDDDLGRIKFTGGDGTNIDSRGAEIIAQVDGTPGVDDMPGRLMFMTTADGSQSTTERMRIDAKGRIGIQGAATKGVLDVRASGGAADQLTAVFGANEGQVGGSLSDNADKASRIGHYHYDLDEEPFGILTASGGSGSNNLTLGGGTSLMNAATQLAFYTAANSTTTNGTKRMSIDSSGNTHFGNGGLNDANVVSVIPADGRISFGMDGRSSLVTGESGCYIFSGEGSSGSILAGELVLQSRSNTNRDMHFATGATPTMRGRFRGADGDFFLGNDLGSITTVGTAIRENDAGGNTYMEMGHNTTGANYSYFICRFGASGTNIGGIAQNSSGNGVTFNTSSDYRLKTNESSITDGITRVKQLKPYQFEWKSDLGTKVDGFFAHEVSSIVPEAITGTKDAVETTYYEEEKHLPEGKSIGDVKETDRPVYQSIDQSKIVPLLTAALQEAIVKIETLETKVAALEG